MHHGLLLIATLTAALALWALLRRRLRAGDRLPALGFALAAGLVAFFAIRLIGSALYWSDPAHHAMPPEPWMSPGFIERSWNLPPASLAPIMGTAPENGKGRNLAEIARQRGEPVADLIARIKAALPDAPGGAVKAR